MDFVKATLSAFQPLVLPDAPEPAYLRTNVLPNDTELPRLEAELDEYIVELEALDEVIEALLKQRDEFEKRITRYESALAPVRRLPPEILTEIFLCGLTDETRPTYNQYPPHSSIKRRTFPWNVSHVSSFWRSIALAEPKLWSTLGLIGSFERILSSNGDTDSLLKLALTHSSDQALDIVLEESCTEFEKSHPLVYCVHDIAILTVKCPLMSLSPFLGRNVRSLKTLVISPSIPPTDQYKLTMSDAPLLREIRIHRTSPVWLDIPWEQITHLEYHDHERSSKLPISWFAKIPNIQSLKLLGHRPGEPTEERIELPQLKSLSVEHVNSISWITDFLYHITTLSLRELTVNDLSRSFIEGLCQFQLQSQFVLSRLTIHTFYRFNPNDVTADRLRFLFNMAQKVTHLSIEGNLVHSELASALLATSTNYELRDLEELQFGRGVMFTKLADNFIEMLISRAKAPLKSITFGDQVFTTNRELCQGLLDQCKANGVSLYCNGRPGSLENMHRDPTTNLRPRAIRPKKVLIEDRADGAVTP